MYMWIVRRWDEYKRQNKNMTAEEAVRKISSETAKDLFHRLAIYSKYYLSRLSQKG